MMIVGAAGEVLRTQAEQLYLRAKLWRHDFSPERFAAYVAREQWLARGRALGASEAELRRFDQRACWSALGIEAERAAALVRLARGQGLFDEALPDGAEIVGGEA
jgi:hypothetical protein